MTRAPLSRRALLKLASGVAAFAVTRRAKAQAPDQGIGGTGVAPAPEERDQGIGGTGVIGTIRRFGSIVVNDLRIAYPADAVVRIDGVPATPEALKIGQVVRVVAVSRDGGLTTRTIEVTSEVVGPVERVGSGSVVVLGQTVSTGELAHAFAGRVGTMVAVSGLRRPDGTIVASLIEARPDGVPLVAGPVRRAKDGRLQIGGLRLAGLDPALVGRRVIVEVGGHRGSYVAVQTTAAPVGFGPRIMHLSIEAYVERGAAGGLRLGSGLVVSGAGSLDLPARGATRAVLATSIGANGGLVVESLRIDRGRGETQRPGSGVPGGPGGRPNDRRGGLPGAPMPDAPGGFGNGPPGAGGFGPPGGGRGPGGPAGGFGGGRGR